jgi:hypothetical protein
MQVFGVYQRSAYIEAYVVLADVVLTKTCIYKSIHCALLKIYTC